MTSRWIASARVQAKSTRTLPISSWEGNLSCVCAWLSVLCALWFRYWFNDNKLMLRIHLGTRRPCLSIPGYPVWAIGRWSNLPRTTAFDSVHSGNCLSHWMQHEGDTGIHCTCPYGHKWGSLQWALAVCLYRWHVNVPMCQLATSLTFMVHQCADYTHCPQRSHKHAVKHIVHYLAGTSKNGYLTVMLMLISLGFGGKKVIKIQF